MSRPLLLDLFCGAGGAAMGYYRAGFDVIGADIELQPHYPFQFAQADAMRALEYMADGARWPWPDAPYPDAIHASPPCQDHSSLRSLTGEHGTGWMLAAARERLMAIGLPWVIENVPGAPMRADYRLCGCMFDLPRLRRDRWFETSWHGFELRPPCAHQGRAITVAGNAGGWSNRDQVDMGSKRDWEAAMGIDWMTIKELAQAIPPAYTEHIGRQLLEQVAATGAAA